jgi:hypothetical protein
MFKNHILNVKFEKLAVIYPFIHNEVETSLSFAIERWVICKQSPGMLPDDAAIVKMDLMMNFQINTLKIGEIKVFDEFTIGFFFGFSFFHGKDDVEFYSNVRLGDTCLWFSRDILTLLASAQAYVDAVKMQPTVQFSTSNIEKESIISYTKMNCSFSVTLDDIKLMLSDSDFSIQIKNLSGPYSINGDVHKGDFVCQAIHFFEKEIERLALPVSNTHFLVTKETAIHPMRFVVKISEPEILIDWLFSIRVMAFTTN